LKTQYPAEPRTQQPQWLNAARHRGFLSALPERLVDELLVGSQRVTYPAGAVSIRWEDRPGPAVVLRGSLRVFLSAPDGIQLTLRYLSVGDLLGWTSLSTTRGVQALEETELLLIDPNRQRALAEREPAVAAALRDDTGRGLDDLLRMYCIRVFGSVRARVANGLLEHARAAGPLVQGTEITMTQAELANEIGTVREVVACTLQGLKRDGIIAIRRGHLTILDPDRLRSEASIGLES
jgi:CRP/FNR family transcriptional regulator, cyclic AMP receptor protein